MSRLDNKKEKIFGPISVHHVSHFIVSGVIGQEKKKSLGAKEKCGAQDKISRNEYLIVVDGSDRQGGAAIIFAFSVASVVKVQH